MGVITEHNALMRRKKERKKEGERESGRQGGGGKGKNKQENERSKTVLEFSSNTPDELHFISAALLCLS